MSWAILFSQLQSLLPLERIVFPNPPADLGEGPSGDFLRITVPTWPSTRRCGTCSSLWPGQLQEGHQ